MLKVKIIVMGLIGGVTLSLAAEKTIFPSCDSEESLILPKRTRSYHEKLLTEYFFPEKSSDIQPRTPTIDEQSSHTAASGDCH